MATVHYQTKSKFTVKGGARAFISSDVGRLVQRSNNGSQMTDTFPTGFIANLDDTTRFHIDIENDDTSATLTLASADATVTFNGYSTVIINPGEKHRVITDGTNFWTSILYPVPVAIGS
jgi:hypothetical protein